MPRYHKLLILFVVVFLCSGPLLSQPQASNYPEDAQRLFTLARSLWAELELQNQSYLPGQVSPEEAAERIRRASLFLEAAMTMNSSNEIAAHDLLALLMSEAIDDPGRVSDVLYDYTTLNPYDTQPVDAWVQYRFLSLNDRAAREFYLQQKAIPILNDYPDILSRALTELGILQIEKGDMDTARMAFQQAYSTWHYNYDALARLLQLPLPQQIQTDPLTGRQTSTPAANNSIVQNYDAFLAIRWRLRLRTNPYDLEALLNLIEILNRLGRHELLLDYYRHADELLALQDDSPQRTSLEKQLNLMHMVSLYLDQQYRECIRLAEKALNEHPQEVLVAGLLAKAMSKIGVTTDAQQIVQRTAEQAIQQWRQAPPEQKSQMAADLAWFYCFLQPQPAEALQFAQAACEQSDSDPKNRNLLAYAHILNAQPEPAKELLTQSDPNEPLVALSLARIALAQQEPQTALQHLEKIPVMSAGLLSEPIAQLREELKTQLAPEQPAAPEQSPVSPAQRDLLASAFNRDFDQKELALVSAPQNYIRCQMRLKDDVVSYGDPIIAQINLTNVGDTELILGPGSFLDPRVLILAELTTLSDSAMAQNPPSLTPTTPSGQSIPLCSRYLLQQRVLAPGRTNTMTEALNIGPVRDILQKHPQQNYQITFRMILDPVSDGSGGITGSIRALQPKPVTIRRRAFYPDQKRMQVQIQRLRAGSTDECLQSTELLLGLIQEAQLAREGKISYPLRPINERPIREAFTENLTHREFRVRAWTAFGLQILPLRATGVEAQRLVELLNDSNWFVRFMAVEALRGIADLSEYLQWAANIERDPIALRQVQLYAHQPWQRDLMPIEVPEPNQTPAAPAP